MLVNVNYVNNVKNKSALIEMKWTIVSQLIIPIRITKNLTCIVI